MLNLSVIQKLNCKPLSAFRNVYHKGANNFDVQSCVITSTEKSNTTKEWLVLTIVPE